MRAVLLPLNIVTIHLKAKLNAKLQILWTGEKTYCKTVQHVFVTQWVTQHAYDNHARSHECAEWLEEKIDRKCREKESFKALSIGSFHIVDIEKLIVSYPFRDLDVQHEEVHMFLSFVERQSLGNHCDQHGCAGDTLYPPPPTHTQGKNKTQKTSKKRKR